MLEASKNIAIGVVVCLALGLVLWVLLFLHPSFGDDGLKLHVRFQDIEKINVGTRVTYAGRPVGEVKEISFVPENERTTPRYPNELYTYDLTIAIDSHIPVYNTDEITIGTSGLMGEKFIAIVPHGKQGNQSKILTENQVIYSEKPPSVEDAFTQVSQLVTKADQTIETITSLIKENRDEVTDSLKSIKSSFGELDKLLKQTNESGLITSFSNVSAQLSRTMTSAEKTLDSLNQANLVSKMGSALHHLDSIAATLDQPEKLNGMFASLDKASLAINNVSNAADTLQNLMSHVAEGQGSVGKLLVSNDFYFKTMAVMNKLDLIMNDVNHYGVLYHLDKGWQRDRRKRIDELSRLQNPQEFKTYLNEEMFKITSSLSRVGMALDKAETLNDKTEFGRTFNDLLSQIQDLQASLKNYSIEIAERHEKGSAEE